MDTNTIIILTAVICFILVFAVLFIILLRKGQINAKKGYVFTHWFNGCKPYLNTNEFNQHVFDLIDRATLEKKSIKGMRVELIIENDEEN